MGISKPVVRQAAVLAVGLAISLPAFGKGIPLLRNSADNDAAVTLVDTPVTIDVLANDTLASGETLLRISKKPRHGTARVVNGEVLYTPDPGYAGSDSFNYITLGLGRAGRGRVDVDMGVPFAFSGTVTDAPVANATVTATIGGFSYTTVADGDGNYTLNIIGTGRDMVVLGARGGPGQAAVNFLSVVGQFDRLQAEAGVDGVLDRTENNQVQVTHLSTAEAYLLQQANGGDIGSDSDLEAARDALDVNTLLRLAAAIKLVVDEGFLLPPGADDVLEMIGDPALFEQFVDSAEAISPGAMDAAMQATIMDPAVTPVMTAEDYVGDYTLLYELGAPGTIRVGIGQGERVELAADGTGHYINWWALNADPSLTWSFIDNEVVIVFNSPTSYTYFPMIDGHGQVRRVVTDVGIALTRLVDGGGRDIVSIRYHSHMAHPDNPEIDDVDTVSTYTMLSIRDDAAGRPFRTSEFPALRALPVVQPDNATNPSGYFFFDFAADGTGLRGDGAPFTWTLDEEGRLLVEYQEGNWTRYTRLATDGRKGDGVVAVHQWQGMMLAEWSISNEFDGSLEFSAANLANTWRSGFDTSQASLDPQTDGTYLVLHPDGSAVQTLRFTGDPTIRNTFQTWRFDAGNGTMESTVFHDDTGWVPTCTPPENGCYVRQQRVWDPIAMDGNRIYVIETVLGDSDRDTTLEVQAQRGNFYDSEALPWVID